jgi:hypothetical protein
MRALETLKRRFCIAQLLCATSRVELGFEGWADAVMETGHGILLRWSCEKILLASPGGRLIKGADIETQLLHVACIASTVTVAAGGIDSTTAAGNCTGGCHATSAAAASTASEATRTTRRIGVGLALGHEVQEGMTVASVKVIGMLDLDLG